MNQNASTFALTQLGQIALVAHDLDRAVAFYRDTLGMPLLFQAPGMAFFDCGGIRLMLTLNHDPQFDHPSSILYYRVADIHAAKAALEARGARFETEPRLIARMSDHDLWMAFLRDSEGNPLQLMSEVRPG